MRSPPPRGRESSRCRRCQPSPRPSTRTSLPYDQEEMTEIRGQGRQRHRHLSGEFFPAISARGRACSVARADRGQTPLLSICATVARPRSLDAMANVWQEAHRRHKNPTRYACRPPFRPHDYVTGSQAFSTTRPKIPASPAEMVAEGQHIHNKFNLPNAPKLPLLTKGARVGGADGRLPEWQAE